LASPLPPQTMSERPVHTAVGSIRPRSGLRERRPTVGCEVVAKATRTAVRWKRHHLLVWAGTTRCLPANTAANSLRADGIAASRCQWLVDRIADKERACQLPGRRRWAGSSVAPHEQAVVSIRNSGSAVAGRGRHCDPPPAIRHRVIGSPAGEPRRIDDSSPYEDSARLVQCRAASCVTPATRVVLARARRSGGPARRLRLRTRGSW
jgi:hypothetical protein